MEIFYETSKGHGDTPCQHHYREPHGLDWLVLSDFGEDYTRTALHLLRTLGLLEVLLERVEELHLHIRWDFK